MSIAPHDQSSGPMVPSSGIPNLDAGNGFPQQPAGHHDTLPPQPHPPSLAWAILLGLLGAGIAHYKVRQQSQTMSVAKYYVAAAISTVISIVVGIALPFLILAVSLGGISSGSSPESPAPPVAAPTVPGPQGSESAAPSVIRDPLRSRGGLYIYDTSAPGVVDGSIGSIVLRMEVQREQYIRAPQDTFREQANSIDDFYGSPTSPGYKSDKYMSTLGYEGKSIMTNRAKATRKGDVITVTDLDLVMGGVSHFFNATYVWSDVTHRWVTQDHTWPELKS